MPFNPQIPLGGQPVQAPTPFQTFGDMMRVKQSVDAQRIQRQQERIGDIQLERVEQEKQDDDYFHNLMQQHAGKDGQPDWQAISRSALASGKFAVADKAQKRYDDVLKAQDVREAADLKRIRDGVGLVGGMFRAAQRATTPEGKQAQWDFARQMVTDVFGTEGPGPDGKPSKVAPAWIDKVVPPQYSDEAADSIGMLGVGIDDEIKLLDFGIKKRGEAITQAKAGADASVAQREALGAYFATAHTPQDVANVVKAAKETYKAPDEIINFFLAGKPPEAMTPEDLKALNARGRQLAMSAKDFAGVLDQDADRAIAATNAATAKKRLEFDMSRGTRDDPSLPFGVKDYIVSIPLKQKSDKGGVQSPFSLADAVADLRTAMPSLMKEHPGLDGSKATKLLNALYGKTDTLFGDWGGGGTDVSGDTTDAPPPAADAPPSAPPITGGPAAAAAIAPPRQAAAKEKEQRLIQGILSEWNGQRWVPVKR